MLEPGDQPPATDDAPGSSPEEAAPDASPEVMAPTGSATAEPAATERAPETALAAEPAALESPAEPALEPAPTPAAPDLAPEPAPAPDLPAPAWDRTYELPNARKVVSAGLQLAVASSRQIRDASIYIGLLSLAALGPVAVLVLVGIARLLSVPGTIDALLADPTQLMLEQPDLVGPLALMYILALVGLLLLLTISIDAQSMAIALLGGVAAERPLRLWETVLRARQTFWRIAGAGGLVGLVSVIVTLVLSAPFLRPFDSNTGVTFITSMIGTLVVTPFAFAAAGIVLGNVGVTESLRRSVRLFRARPRIALVVTLFTLVTAAIQTFALGAGLDVAIRVGELLQLEVDQGGVALILPSILVLAFIVAFGSLTFTIAAIVAAPQVAAFLGLTYYSAGLDLARTEGPTKPPGIRWVTRKMLGSVAALGLLSAFGVSSLASFQPRPPSPVSAFLNQAASTHGDFLSTYGSSRVTEDPPGDQAADRPGADILAGSYGWIPDVPDWFLESIFGCDADGVACPPGGSSNAAFTEGALVFVQRMARSPALPDSRRRDWAAVMEVEDARRAPQTRGLRFPGATHAVITQFEGRRQEVVLLAYDGGTFVSQPTDARSLWAGDDLVTLVPLGELPGWPLRWDVYASESDRTSQPEAHDRLRPGDLDPLLPFDDPPYFVFFSFEEG